MSVEVLDDELFTFDGGGKQPIIAARSRFDEMDDANDINRRRFNSVDAHFDHGSLTPSTSSPRHTTVSLDSPGSAGGAMPWEDPQEVLQRKAAGASVSANRRINVSRQPSMEKMDMRSALADDDDVDEDDRDDNSDRLFVPKHPNATSSPRAMETKRGSTVSTNQWVSAAASLVSSSSSATNTAAATSSSSKTMGRIESSTSTGAGGAWTSRSPMTKLTVASSLETDDDDDAADKDEDDDADEEEVSLQELQQAFKKCTVESGGRQTVANLV